jgi:hypothetical protein
MYGIDTSPHICDDYLQLIFGKTDGTAPFEYCMTDRSRKVVDADNCQTALIEVFNMCFTNKIINMHKYPWMQK